MESKCKVNSDGTKLWYNSRGQLHREDGPAIECTNGDKCWYLNNRRHREDGLAIEYVSGNGKNEFRLNDMLYECPTQMPLTLFLAYCKWEYKKNG